MRPGVLETIKIGDKASSVQRPASSVQRPASSVQRPASSVQRQLTLPSERQIVLAGRTQQALARLHFDLAPLFAADPRIDYRYAIVPGSDHALPAKRFILKYDLPEVDWEDVTKSNTDLVITASPRGFIFDRGIPTVVIPHGAGHNRLLPDTSGVAGLCREHLVSDSGAKPSFIALPGAVAYRQLRQECPEALDRADITGDVCWERFHISEDRRQHYRRALGVSDTQKLIVLASTWGRDSLVGRDHSAIPKLHEWLSDPETVVAFVPHPNIDSGNPPSTDHRYASHVRNGLIMVPPEEGWRSLIVAADYIVGDHGSVTVYAAALGRPVAIGEFGFSEMPAEGALARLGRELPRLQWSERPSVERLTSQCERVDASVIGDIFDLSRDSPAQLIVERCYELLELSPTQASYPIAFPEPGFRIDYRPTSSWQVHYSSDGADVHPLCSLGSRDSPDFIVTSTQTLDYRIKGIAEVVTSLERPVEDVAHAWEENARILDESQVHGMAVTAFGVDRYAVTFKSGYRGILRVKGNPIRALADLFYYRTLGSTVDGLDFEPMPYKPGVLRTDILLQCRYPVFDVVGPGRVAAFPNGECGFQTPQLKILIA